MILARHRRGDDARGPVPCSASAVAPRRGDVTTAMAAAAVRLRAEERAGEVRDRAPARSMVDLVRASAAR